MVSSRLRRVREMFPSASIGERVRIAEILRKETIGGMLLVACAAVALIWANSPWADHYFALRDLQVGYEPWHLRLSLGAWASDGLLAIFFFMVGLELKREIAIGDLRRIRTAVIPIAAAIGGVVVPAVIFVAIVWNSPDLRNGWAIPTATDIAFAVAVLAIVGSRLPSALRIFLLTLAVVDDLIAISIIAVFYTDTINFVPLLIGLAVIAVYAVIAQRYRVLFHRHTFAAWLVLLPIGAVAWAFVHASGVHATIAGVLLGFTVPVLHRAQDSIGDAPSLAEEFEHRFRPLSTGIAVPIFAFFSAGVTVGGFDGLRMALSDPLTIGIVAGLVIGKPIGITIVTWTITRIRNIDLDPALRWVDIIGVSLLAGIGFTVSLLVAELSFAPASAEGDHAKVAILVASITAALLASVLLQIRNRRHAAVERSTGEQHPDA